MLIAPDVLARGDWPEIAAAFGAAVARALAGCPTGSVFVQVREKDLDGRPLLALVRAAAAHAPVLVNDRIDVALAARASAADAPDAPDVGVVGAHLPERGLPIAVARSLAPALVLGTSRHAAPGETGADLVHLGPIWPTPSKPGAPGLGEAALAAPHGRAVLVAIGGVDTPERAERAAAAGADAVAIIRAAWTGASLAPLIAAVEAGRERR